MRSGMPFIALALLCFTIGAARNSAFLLLGFVCLAIGIAKNRRDRQSTKS